MVSDLRPEINQKWNFFQYSNCVRNNCLLPMSVILINDQNGSRTIVHHRGAMPEITLEDFQKLNLNDYRMVKSMSVTELNIEFWLAIANVKSEPKISWIHFEGRTKSGERPHVTQILKYLQQEKSKFNFKVSVELEKTYEGMSDLGILADVVFVSKVGVQIKRKSGWFGARMTLFEPLKGIFSILWIEHAWIND